MFKKLVVLSSLLSTAHAFAGIELPRIQPDQELCYERIYTAAEIAKDNRRTHEGNSQRVKALAVSLAKGANAADPVIATVMIRTLDGRSYKNGGSVQSVDGKALSQLDGRDVWVETDLIEGQLKVHQSQARKGSILVRSANTSFMPVDENWEVSEDTHLDRPLLIQLGDSDDSMRVDRLHSNGSAKSCGEIFSTDLGT